MNFEQPLLSTEDVAGYLNVDVVTVRRLVRRGELHAYRIGGEYRFAREDLRDYLERQRVPARAAGAGATQAVAVGATLPFPLILPEDMTFTADAEHVLQATVEEARRFNQPHVGTEHLLLALVRDPEETAGKLLRRVGVNDMQAQRAVEFLVGRGDMLSAGVQIQMSATFRKVCDAAVAAARERKTLQVGTEHLLLALLGFEGVAATALDMLEVRAELLRAAVLEELGRH